MMVAKEQPPMVPDGTAQQRLAFVDYLSSLIEEFSGLRMRKQFIKLPDSHLITLSEALGYIAQDAQTYNHRHLYQATRSLNACIGETLQGTNPDRLYNMMRAFDDFLLEARKSRAAEEELGLNALLDETAQRKKVLLVDDDHFVHNMVSRAIGEEVEVYSAYNGKAALETIQTERPDLIILDVRMPEMDGHELLKRIKSLKECSSIPVVMLSNDAGDRNVVAGMVSGAVDFLSKSIAVADLRERLLEMLKNGRMRLEAPCH